MDEYLKRSDLLAEYDRQHKGPPGAARRLIAEAPAADVVPVVHARWLYAINTRRRYAPVADDMICSACNRVTERLDGINYLYCPYCGARMEGE